MKKFILIILIFAAFRANGQIKITGQVRDSISGDALQQASIYLKGMPYGTITDQNGNFLLEVPADSNIILDISFMGFKNKSIEPEIPENKNIHLNILLSPLVYDLDQTIVTVNRYKQNINEIPGTVNVVDPKMIKSLPANNPDDYLRSLPNIYINRTWGIFTKSAGITMHGLSGTTRTLVLLDGVPLNKSAGGSLSWDIIKPDDIDHIEVVKGASSALYGNNAMAGVINFITRKPVKPLEGRIKLSAGTYNTFGGDFEFGSARKLSRNREFSVNIFGHKRTGDGYVVEPPETRTAYDSKVWLKEWNLGAGISYLTAKQQKLEVKYIYHDEWHGAGTKVYERDGSFDRYRNHYLHLNFSGKLGKYNYQSKLFYQRENYDRLNENINTSGQYKLYDTYSNSSDAGLWLSFDRQILWNSHLIFGTDLKFGNLDGKDVYRTSTDIQKYGGELYFAGFFVQDEIPLIGQKLSLTAGLRFDIASYENGFLSVIDPTSNTGFKGDYNTSYPSGNWNQISPKLSLRYIPSNSMAFYISYSKGFMPPKIDDLCRSGKITKGFKLANPSLKPEKADNFEAGGNAYLGNKWEMSAAIYLTMGRDFQYFVGTGDSVDTGGNQLKPVLKRQNISEVEIIGGEFSLKYHPGKNLAIFANYSYNHGTIINYKINPELNKDLTGNSLIELPDQLASGGIYWENKIVNASILVTYVGSNWYDDENTTLIQAFTTIDIKIYRTFFKKFGISLSVENLLDEQYIDRKGRVGPGRFIMAELSYKI